MFTIIDMATGTPIASLLKRPLGDTWWPTTDGSRFNIIKIEGNNVFVKECPHCVIMDFEDVQQMIKEAHASRR